MGKSNRFDYHARPNAGTKLGELIGRDLEKEADKALKDAEKQAARVRKRSTSSADSSSLNEAIVHHLDIKVPSKQLGDDGAIAMADGLERALQNGTQDACVVLEDLDLTVSRAVETTRAGNTITTAALERLAPAIKLAKHNVKTLNLSNNAIKVETDQEAKQWQTFLCSFKDCHRMQRLDISGNQLGSRALEVFAQVYSKEPPIEHMSANGDVSVLSLLDQSDSAEPTPTAANFTDPVSHARHFKRHCGLRAIPYIALNNIGLDDAGALWLSYIIEEHVGIDWNQSEPDLGKDGLQLLRRAQAVRQRSVVCEADDGEPSRAIDSQATQATRRASVRSVASDDMSELESARKKVQRAIIEKHGLSCSELWQTSLHICLTARTIVGIGPGPRSGIYNGPSTFDGISRPITPVNRSKSNRGSPVHTTRQGIYAATLTANTDDVAGAPSIAITEVTNTPSTPRMVSRPHRKGGMSDGSDVNIDMEAANQKLSKLNLCIERDNSPMRFVEFQQGICGSGVGICYRDTSVPSHLPAKLMEKVALDAVDLWKQQLLTEKQRGQCIEWGLSRKNIEIEQEWHKMADSAQALTLLERIGCLK